MASIQVLHRKSGKRYRVQFMKNGKRIGKVFSRKKDAELYIAQLTVNDQLADSLTDSTLSSLTISQANKEFLEQYSGKCSSMKQRLSFWSSNYGDICIGKFTRFHIKQGMNKLNEIGYAPATLNRFKAAISAVFTYLGDEYDVPINPARQVRQQKENNARCRYLSDEERIILLDTVKKSYWNKLYLLVLLAITTGARRGDLIKLRWSDINFTARTATVDVTKNGEPRVLPLTTDVVKELSKYREIGGGYIFNHPSKLNEYFRNFDCHWRSALIEAKIDNFKFHDLRHTAASYLAMANIQIGQIADILGHKTLDVTKRYIHLSTGHKANVINDVMGGIS
ncbi:tyrosine-type recombinase/integrase [Litorilituus lipolyticus]|uniref:Site-specific integrase n=1 Tax=Litorilituus lipolyticus TaxID=2491017 RepID=A0A502L6E5_9GAMM|nr:site-specific integrase [Litorilituus lipolyticus]TPH18499.1 site-specific integrase [Litorilituus lipolyticus]